MHFLNEENTVGKKEEGLCYVMVFCALILVKNSKATVDQAMRLVPLAGNARFLAHELVSLPALKG